nr:hypothetical protein [uncultured Blautia sp.]
MKKKSVTVLLAAATLSATLIGGQVLPAYAGDSQAVEASSLIPDNVTIDEPTALANIALPRSEYGTLSWADGSYVPDKRVQSCEVIFTPAGKTDLSDVSGWDSSTGTVTGYVTVVVSSIDSSQDSGGDSDYSDIYEDGSDEKNDSAKVTEIPTVTEAPEQETEVTAIPEADPDGETNLTATPEVTVAPETDKEEATETPEADPTETPEITEIPDKVGDEEPEISTAPASDEEKEDKDKAPEETPEETIAPGTDKEEATETPEADPTATPEETEEPEQEYPQITAEVTETPEITEVETPTEVTDIFDREDQEETDERPIVAEENLTEEEKEAIAVQNHTCDGISVSGIDLPWYVQFRVTGGEDYTFTNEEDATIFKSYEFELWDTRNNTEYTIPDGEYISVTVPVKAGYTYSIEHILDSGAMETIIPSVDGSTMTFSTHSFSPFGIAGSKSLVGPDADETTPTSTPAQVSAGNVTDEDIDSSAKATSTPAAVQATTSTAAENTSGSSAQNTNDAEDMTAGTKSSKNVETGDNTRILPFVILFAAAAAVAAVVVVVLKKKK